MKQNTLKVLVVSASARQSDSVTRRFSDEIVAALRQQYAQISLRYRDVATGLPFIDEQWVNASFTSKEQRSQTQRAALAVSDGLVEEVQEADLILIGAPIYNFSIPASLKAWIDQIARVGVTFTYNESGPVGLLENKKAYIVYASGKGGTQLGSEIDFSSAYLRHVLGFMGISDVSVLSAAQFDAQNAQQTQTIRRQIEELAQQAA